MPRSKGNTWKYKRCHCCLFGWKTSIPKKRSKLQFDLYKAKKTFLLKWNNSDSHVISIRIFTRLNNFKRYIGNFFEFLSSLKRLLNFLVNLIWQTSNSDFSENVGFCCISLRTCIFLSYEIFWKKLNSYIYKFMLLTPFKMSVKF